MAKPKILKQLDNLEKRDIVTDEELLRRGVIYDSRRRLGEAQRRIFEDYRNTEKTRLQTGLADKRTISRATSLVEESRIHETRNVNFIGKQINSHENAAALLSLFRDPRIEISHIILTSDNGDIIAHRAYTSGVPGAVARYPEEIFNYLTNEIKAFNPKEAWISHNHPSGNPEPSFEDIVSAKKAGELFNKLNISFQGSLILGDENYSVINSNGQYFQKEFPPEQKKYNHELLKQERLTQASLCETFKDILTQEDDINIIAVLNGDNKLVSWNYIDNEKEVEPIYDYLRASGGQCVSILSNNENTCKYYEKLTKDNLDTKRDIFLDILQYDTTTSKFVYSFTNEKCSWDKNIALNNPVMHLINRDVLQQERLIETARKLGHVHGVCECVAALGDNYTLGKKLLTEMDVDKDMAQKFANPETFKKLEQGIFAQKHDQKLEQTQGVKR